MLTNVSSNPEEAKMIAAFYRHLSKNGIGPEQITVLTFYNGQRKKILNALRTYPDITAGYLQVKTVDSYQGEENNVVILSLTRSNEDGRIGFLANINRVCVALSRAKFGFYIFGNARAMMAGSELWYNVVQRMSANPKRLHNALPIQCKNHGVTCLMQYPEDWKNTEGGCRNACDTTLDCGHQCPLWCHPYSHDKVQCPEDCMKKLPCSHGCDRKCSQPCYCSCDEFARVQKLEMEKAWSMPNPSAVGPNIQDIMAYQGFNGQSVPSIGSTPYLQQQLPAGSRDTGYKVGEAWNPTPKETIESHRLTAEKQHERRQGWHTYAKGGVVVDDKRRVAMEKSQSMPTIDTSFSVKKESIRAVGDGRKMFMQESEYVPEAAASKEIGQKGGNDTMNELAGLIFSSD